MFTPAEKKLLAYILERASEEFANHSCNDLDLVKQAKLTSEESLEIRKLITKTGDYPNDPVPADNHYVMDWLVMSYFAKKFSS